MLTSLRELGHRLAVLTNGDQSQQEDKLALIGIDDLVDDLFTSSRLCAAKPDPQCFVAATELLGLSPGQCLMVGDDLAKDVVGARAAGWSAVWLNRNDAHVAMSKDRQRLDIDDVQAITTLAQLNG